MMVLSNFSGDLSEEMEGDAFRQLIPLLLFEPRLANLYSLVQDPSDKPIGILGWLESFTALAWFSLFFDITGDVSFVEASAIVNICCTVSDDEGKGDALRMEPVKKDEEGHAK